MFAQNVDCVIPGQLDNITGTLRGNGFAMGYFSRELLLRLNLMTKREISPILKLHLQFPELPTFPQVGLINLIHGLLTTSLFVCSFVVNLSGEDSLLYLCVRAGCSFCSCASMIKVQRRIELVMNKYDCRRKHGHLLLSRLSASKTIYVFCFKTLMMADFIILFPIASVWVTFHLCVRSSF